MRTLVFILIIAALLATLTVLIRGVVGLVRGNDPRRSNQLMQMRVLFQFVALLLIGAFLYLSQHKP